LLSKVIKLGNTCAKNISYTQGKFTRVVPADDFEKGCREVID
jgi:hypothetical protein